MERHTNRVRLYLSYPICYRRGMNERNERPASAQISNKEIGQRLRELEGWMELGKQSEALAEARRMLRTRPLPPVLFTAAVEAILIQADFSAAVVDNSNPLSIKYQLETDAAPDAETDFIIYDNDGNGKLTEGDTLLIDKDDVTTGDTVDLVFSGKNVSLTRF